MTDTNKTSTLRPGLLVSLKTTVSGNVRYSKRVIDAAAVDDAGVQKARWETERTIMDPVEHDEARLACSKARTAVTRVCAQSAFSLLCPEVDAEALETAIADARAIAEAFNATAKLSRVYVYVITGRIAPNDVEAVKAINSEIAGLMDDMQRGVSDADVKTIREAAKRAKGIAEILSKEARLQAEIAIDAARRAARDIVKAEGSPIRVDAKAVRAITEARTMFLDVGEAAPVSAPAEQGVALDLAAE